MGTNKKQTAVQQLWDELEELNLPNWQRDFRPILMKAKQMEREQMMNSWINGSSGEVESEYFDEYYKETYGK